MAKNVSCSRATQTCPGNREIFVIVWPSPQKTTCSGSPNKHIVLCCGRFQAQKQVFFESAHLLPRQGGVAGHSCIFFVQVRVRIAIPRPAGGVKKPYPAQKVKLRPTPPKRVKNWSLGEIVGQKSLDFWLQAHFGGVGRDPSETLPGTLFDFFLPGEGLDFSGFKRCWRICTPPLHSFPSRVPDPPVLLFTELPFPVELLAEAFLH